MQIQNQKNINNLNPVRIHTFEHNTNKNPVPLNSRSFKQLSSRRTNFCTKVCRYDSLRS